MHATMNGTGTATTPRDTREGVDPFAFVFSMGMRIPIAAAIAISVSLHVSAMASTLSALVFSDMAKWSDLVRDTVKAQLTQIYEVELLKPEEKAPEPPPPEPEPVKEETPPEPPPPVVKEETPPPKTDAPPPPPVAAEAAKVLTQEPAPDEPVDLTGNTFVTGSGSTYAGGTTQAGGTSKTAVYNPAAAATGLPGGKGTEPAPVVPKVDRSRAAGLSGGDRWDDCPFPPEADAEQIDQAYVTIQVKVNADGMAESVAVLQDPGHGFAREAKKCGMRKHYATALDVDGRPVAGSTKPIRIHFER